MTGAELIGSAQYVPAGREVELLLSAYERRTPVLLLGPTGCGKTRLVEHAAEQLRRPLITVTCHDDMTTADLVGRHLIRGGDVSWSDGPLSTAMREGAICYLDEIVEARSDTLAVLHSVTDHRRTLYIDRLSEELVAAPEFLLIASYNPRPAGSPKRLKPSLSQRFATIHMSYLPPATETRVVAQAGGVPTETARNLVDVAIVLRRAAAEAEVRFDPPSTRTLILAAGLIAAGAPLPEALETCVIGPLSPDESTAHALRELARAAAVEGQSEGGDA